MTSSVFARSKRWPVAGRSDESFRGRALKVRLSDIVGAVREQMETIDYGYEPEHPYSRVAYLDPGSPDGGGVVDASEVPSLSVDQRRSMMVLGPYGHIACGTHDAPVYYAGSDENRREMERLQETLEKVGRRLVEWRQLGGFVVPFLAILVVVGGPPLILGLTSEDAPLLAWLIVIPTGPITALLAKEPLRHLAASAPRPHELVLS